MNPTASAAASFGFQFGAQRKSLILIFLDEESLWRFRYSDAWRVGVDISVAVAEVGIGEAECRQHD